MPKFLDYFKNHGSHKFSFQIMTVISIFCFILSLIAFIYQFVFFGESDSDKGLYMNLTSSPMNGTCSSEPFDSNTPLDFTYKTEQGEYSFTCMYPLFFQVIAHLAVIFLVTTLSIGSYVFGLILVQRKGLIFDIGYGIASIGMAIIGVAEVCLAISSNNFCKNDLLSQVDFSLSQIQPTGITCHFQHYVAFGIYQVIIGVITFLHSISVGYFYLHYRKQKIEERKQNAKPYEDLKFDDYGKVVNKNFDEDGSQPIELTQPLGSHVGTEETPANDSRTEHAILAD
ncbi:hypothetical protein ENUP19_0041G0087 [Entamoeba nuttalli]|uniref:Transmembrane protein n=2 Tax=Entamoeba nuttalli TaxID=412467 RepID=K2GDA5_ENTNP|nr:hypothetical protein ENU1_087220 [Entamoeba nuttalli P19]EKE40541.1 hypothetical protein ENU1_087220 [Entamoeba nuttalli P19]|eukprot:XP_008857129.1 hypothetical protein ENU1_087220 [Entamoeba nuttalli P19]